MQSVANLDVSNTAGTSGTMDLSDAKKAEGQDADDESLVEQSSEDKQEVKAKTTELNQAAEMGIIDKKYEHEDQDGED